MLRFETGVNKDRQAQLRDSLRRTNAELSPTLRPLLETHSEEELPLHVWCLDGSTGELTGGLTGRTWARWLHVDLLWVQGRVRGTGVGRQLLAEAERMAREERGCARSRLDTWDFQAPGFYVKQGYEVVGEVADYPPGVTEYTLVKRLADLPAG